jgi:hypothetical protein
MRPYQYTPLEKNEIRLISLHPSSSGAPLSITIRHVRNFSDSEPYEALSYVWGNSETTYSLYCKNSTNLLITPNLRSALLALRLPDTPRVLWVDAICINQNNTVEQGSQVSMMRQIYKGAKRTVVYLGDEADDSAFAAVFLTLLVKRVNCGVIAELEKDIDKKDKLKDLFQDVARQLGSTWEELFKPLPPEKTLRAIVYLLARPWFQRVWVIQEFAVSKDIQMLVGTDEIELTSFVLAFGYAFPAAQVTWHEFGEPSTLRGFYRGLSQILEMHDLRQGIQNEEGERRYRITVLLSSCRRAQATKGCDKIYALLGLSRDALSHVPDYSLSNKLAFTLFAAGCIEHGGADGENILYEACVSDEREEGIPSWVPDWRCLPKRRNLGHSFTGSPVTFFHAGKTPSYLNSYLKLEGAKAVTKGILLHTVVVLGPAQAADDGSNLHLEHLVNVLQSMQGFRWSCTLSNEHYPTGENIDEVLARVLEAGQPRDADQYLNSARESQTVRDIQLEMIIADYEHTANHYPLTLAEIRRLYKEEPQGLRNAARAIAGRVFGLTDRCYAGLFPSNTRYGDRICIFQGFRVPFVLRRGSEGCWILVGDAYVHGMMQGEMVGDGSRFQEIKMQ